MAEDGGSGEHGVTSLEGVLLGFSPFELLIFLEKEHKMLDNMIEVFNEMQVIVSECNGGVPATWSCLHVTV